MIPNIKTLRSEGVDQYNNEQYDKAQRTFTRLVQHFSMSTQDYLKLARAAYYNKDYENSSVAYQIYFELKKSKHSGLQKEHEEVQQHIKNGSDKRRRKAYRSRIEEVLKLIKEEKLFGKRGSLEALKDVHQSRIFEPRFNRAHKRFKRLMINRYMQLLTQWYSLEKQLPLKEATTLLELLEDWGAQTWGDLDRTKEISEVLKSLINMRRGSMDGLKKLLMIKTKDSKIRYAQMIVLSKLNRFEEAYLLADALALQTKGDEHRRFLMMKSLFAVQSDKPDATDAFVDALLVSPFDLKKAATRPMPYTSSTAPKP